MSAPANRKSKVAMLGLRGIPRVQGGVEAHVRALSEGLVQRGWDVEVLGRRPYLPDESPRVWRGIVVRRLWAPKRTSLEAIAHSVVGVFAALASKPDILHIHAIGPSLVAPLARAVGLTVVVTHHGYDYDRQKWGAFAKAILRLGEKFGMRFANGRIAISDEVARTMKDRYGVPVRFVPNGVEVKTAPEGDATPRGFGLTPGRYVVMVARIVPEKRQLDLIEAFARLGDPAVKLAIVGYAEFGSAYLAEVEAAARRTPNVVMTGFQVDEPLMELFANAALFVLPSSHEGMPIALLEALALGLPVLASDISANLALGLEADDYFPLGDVERLAGGIRRKLAAPLSPAARAARIAETDARYGWGPIVEQTIDLYDEARGQGQHSRDLSDAAERRPNA